MAWLWHALLGLVQGLTEFLPVSSSGHLAAAKMALQDAGAPGSAAVFAMPPLLLEVFLHVGTLAAVCLFYRREIRDILAGAGRALGRTVSGQGFGAWRDDPGARMLLLLLLAMAPTGLVGLALKGAAERASGSRLGLGWCFLVLTAVLAATRWLQGGKRTPNWKIALLVGLAQGAAVLPGVSRSGLTIAVGLAAGLQAREAAAFSFLLSVPAVLAAVGLETLEAGSGLGAGLGLPVLAGALAAFASGYAALVVLVRMVSAGRLWWFAPYTAAIGLLLLAVA